MKKKCSSCMLLDRIVSYHVITMNNIYNNTINQHLRKYHHKDTRKASNRIYISVSFTLVFNTRVKIFKNYPRLQNKSKY